jgi:hypothetical protein
MISKYCLNHFVSIFLENRYNLVYLYMDDIYEKKYYKYKAKYLLLKYQLGGNILPNPSPPCIKKCGRMSNLPHKTCCRACDGNKDNSHHTDDCNDRNLEAMRISFDDKTLASSTRKSVDIGNWSMLHEILSKIYNELNKQFPRDMNPSFTYPLFHAELVTSQKKPTDSLQPAEIVLKNTNFKTYNEARINLKAKANWNCEGDGFGLILNDNGVGTPSGQKKVIHITLGYFPNGCGPTQLNQCLKSVEKVIGPLH